MKYKSIYEFLVWDNCNNNCKFCFQRENPRLFSYSKRKYILDEVISFIDSDKFIKGSHILICGGEIFDKPKDFNNLSIFFDKIISYMKNNIIDLLYINTNLIYANLSGVMNLLDKIKEAGFFDRLKFTTSYDLEGRFKTEEIRNLMLNNLIYLTNKYKDLKVVTNIILTKQVCESIINNKLNISEFMTKYNCWVNLIPYIVLDDNLTAERKDIFKSLYTVEKQSPGYLSKYVPNMTITQEKLLYMYKNDKFVFCSCEIDKCGHSINFKRYSKHNTCFCCDLREIFNEYI